MVIVFKLLAVMLCIVYCLKRRLALGHTMLLAALALFILVAPDPAVLRNVLERTLTSAGTWRLMAAMYLVMCLEHQLRTTGVLDRFMDTVRRVLSDKVLLAVMPGLIGFLPSLGGAIMSCPMVESASQRLSVSAEQKSTMNYWFRHIGEYANPIVPGMLLASEILNMPLRDLLVMLAPVGVFSMALGWFFLLAGVRAAPAAARAEDTTAATAPFRSVAQAIGPILLNIVLVVVFRMDAASSLAIVILVMVLVLRQRPRAIAAMVHGAYNFNLLWGVFGIICFQNMFNMSGAVTQFLHYMETTPVPIDFIVILIAFLGGLLCGVGQSMIALAFPIIAAMDAPDLRLIACAYVFGTSGQMISPVHLCYPITVEYFHADIVKPMVPVMAMQGIIMAVVFAATQWLL